MVTSKIAVWYRQNISRLERGSEMGSKCESCGMPLKDKVKGVRKDGTPSEHYCNLCYENGEFKHPDATVEEMMKYSVEGMSQSGWPKFLAKLMVKNIPKLPRWQQEDTSKPVE